MAKLEDLKNAWQSQSGISQERFDQIGSKVRSTSNLLRSTIFRRDMRETIASLLVFVIFFPGLLHAKNWVAWSGFAIEVIAGATIPFVLWWARRRSPVEVAAANFRDFVDIESGFLTRQVQLLRMVTWWYLLPIYVGIVLIMIGLTYPRYTQAEVIFVTLYLVLSAGLFVFIWWLNQSARKTKFEPLLDYYIEMREALDSGDDSALQLPDPPSTCLQPTPRKPITRRQRWTWIGLTTIVTALVAVAGIATMHFFDARTGIFVAVTAPVIAILMIYISGIWRRSSA